MIRIAIVGLGWWGKTLVEAVQGKSDRLRFVAAATRSRSDEQRRFASEHGLELHDSYEDLLEDSQLDAVLLATPPTTHRDQMLAAIAAGKHIFAEKPFTVTKTEAIEVVGAAKTAGVTLGLGYNRRFHPSWKDLRERVHSGDLGTILHMESTMTGPNGLSMSPSAWRASRDEAPCGGLFPMAVHAIDGMIELCGEFEEVYAKSYRGAVPNDVDDTMTAVMRMSAGMTAAITTMMATAASSRFQVYGSRGWAQLLGTTHAAGQSAEERRTGIFGSYIVQPIKGEPRHIDVPRFDSVAAELEAFATACSGGPAFPISHEEMIHGAAAAEAIIKSAASGRPEKV
jgi:predicted dehydrogenase